jgi:hypothetical protein
MRRFWGFLALFGDPPQNASFETPRASNPSRATHPDRRGRAPGPRPGPPPPPPGGGTVCRVRTAPAPPPAPSGVPNVVTLSFAAGYIFISLYHLISYFSFVALFLCSSSWRRRWKKLRMLLPGLVCPTPCSVVLRRQVSRTNMRVFGLRRCAETRLVSYHEWLKL